MTLEDSLLHKAQSIRLLALDVDGVLTDGKLYFSNGGDELKAFHIADGLGIKLLKNSGVEVAIITGRQSQLVARRAQELGIVHIMQGREDKLTALNELKGQLNIPYNHIAYVGDDLPDLAAIRQVSLGIAVANAHHYVLKHADWQTDANGGEGAVREVCEWIMQAQDTLMDAWKVF